MELKDFKDAVRVMTKEEFESAINEDIKFVERFKHFFKHRGYMGAGRQETSLSAHQYTIRNCVLWIETPLYTISTCGIRNSS